MAPGPSSCSQNSKISRHHQHCPKRGLGVGVGSLLGKCSYLLSFVTIASEQGVTMFYVQTCRSLSSTDLH